MLRGGSCYLRLAHGQAIRGASMKRLITPTIIALFAFAAIVYAQTFEWDFSSGKPRLDVPAGAGIGIGDVPNGSYFALDQHGRYSAVGDSALAWREVVVDPQSVRVNPVNAKPDYGTWLFPGQTFMFDASSAESLYFEIELPHDAKLGSSIEAHVHWAPSSDNTGNVAWKLAWMMADIDSVFAFTAGDTLSVRDAGVGVPYTHQLADFGSISMGGIAEVSAIMSGVLIRDAARNSDTFTGEAIFLDLGFHYLSDSYGSRWEYKK